MINQKISSDKKLKYIYIYILNLLCALMEIYPLIDKDAFDRY